MLWRCVDIDENGPLILSDKILCLKAFDAAGSDLIGSHGRNSVRETYGSNYWADSNIRSWLNSSAEAGAVEWQCGNPSSEDNIRYGCNAYDDEAGFLSNFTASEIKAMRSVSQKTLVSSAEYDIGLYDTGLKRHDYNISINSVVQNYDTAFAEYVTDKMFLLDVKQVNTVYNNGDILGEDYYIGTPTAECVENSEYDDDQLAEGFALLQELPDIGVQFVDPDILGHAPTSLAASSATPMALSLANLPGTNRAPGRRAVT